MQLDVARDYQERPLSRPAHVTRTRLYYGSMAMSEHRRQPADSGPQRRVPPPPSRHCHQEGSDGGTNRGLPPAVSMHLLVLVGAPASRPTVMSSLHTGCLITRWLIRSTHHATRWSSPD
eukprot:705779-Prymnesium_polylepis.1